jgi:hypothetical protein
MIFMSVTTMGAISCLHALKIRNAFIHGLTPVVFSVVFDNMDIILKKYAHNFIVDEILYLSSEGKKVIKLEYIIPKHGDCCVICTLSDSTKYEIKVDKGLFEDCWNEARIVLSTATSIKGKFSKLNKNEIKLLESERQKIIDLRSQFLKGELYSIINRSINELDDLFKRKEYKMFIENIGTMYNKLPESFLKKIEYIKNKDGLTYR